MNKQVLLADGVPPFCRSSTGYCKWANNYPSFVLERLACAPPSTDCSEPVFPSPSLARSLAHINSTASFHPSLFALRRYLSRLWSLYSCSHLVIVCFFNWAPFAFLRIGGSQRKGERAVVSITWESQICGSVFLCLSSPDMVSSLWHQA
jgi:hypothetical protein